VVVAHPDDESFGLGALLAALVQRRARLRVLCLTRGEASTLGESSDLGEVRARELADAARALGLEAVTLLDHPDGQLADVPATVLDGAVRRARRRASFLVAFEPGGVTGHPDHVAATASAGRVATRLHLPVLEWGVPPSVAATLNEEFGTGFVGVDGADLTIDRTSQLAAIACHHSQSRDNPVLRRRLALQGDCERVRVRVPVRCGPDASAASS
jgi:LmbE family N-acetylglucosaminyl deacetylase